ncbi:hypothetical protein HanRHA438_Chr13g0611311 [Helianthus annuus]|uniref:Uncharacterized protein n=1 Tax=Helianthus annuus TaxID=4232 RepID=A0A9K3EJV7_HELAN|nr:hypothetical protein HanXRQr2_Chr13g0600661 [Helianthus annuus]KAJ0850268.1 hypothetical protein HanPSC8_Chr13g0578671 [Helianthus annuus]KAJ0859341.1 hypothetical protein HanRHA438_Chr13g0611311 [Helianthus annuus]
MCCLHSILSLDPLNLKLRKSNFYRPRRQLARDLPIIVVVDPIGTSMHLQL